MACTFEHVGKAVRIRLVPSHQRIFLFNCALLHFGFFTFLGGYLQIPSREANLENEHFVLFCALLINYILLSLPAMRLWKAALSLREQERLNGLWVLSPAISFMLSAAFFFIVGDAKQLSRLGAGTLVIACSGYLIFVTLQIFGFAHSLEILIGDGEIKIIAWVFGVLKHERAFDVKATEVHLESRRDLELRGFTEFYGQRLAVVLVSGKQTVRVGHFQSEHDASQVYRELTLATSH